jgi:hypothetical protein
VSNPVRIGREHPSHSRIHAARDVRIRACFLGSGSDTVQPRVTLQPTYDRLGPEGLTVYLREFDPDDPSANNNVVDGDLTGGDNQGGACRALPRPKVSDMHLKNSSQALLAVIGGSLAPLVAQVDAAPEARQIGPAHARGIVVVELALDAWDGMADIELTVSNSEGKYVNAGAGVHRGRFGSCVPRRSDGDRVVATIPLVGMFDLGPKGFLFDEDGGQETIDQTIRVSDVLDADEEFLARLGDRSTFERLGLPDFEETFSEKPLAHFPARIPTTVTDFRALGVIGELLKASEALAPDAVPQQLGSREAVASWGQVLGGLAQECPESSYAPYAAFFAGCCYSGNIMGRTQDVIRSEKVPGAPVDRLSEAKRRIEVTKKDEDLHKGLEALTFAVEHGDTYLKPRALLHLATLTCMAGDVGEIEALLSQAEQLAPTNARIMERVAEFRDAIGRLEAEQEEAALDAQE